MIIRMFKCVFFIFVAATLWARAEPVTSVSEFKALPNDPSIQNQPVFIDGVVTIALTLTPPSFLLASTNDPNGPAIFVRASDPRFSPLTAEMCVRVSGVVNPGTLTPSVLPETIHCLGQMPLPEPPLKRLSEIRKEAFDNQRIRITGVFQHVEFMLDKPYQALLVQVRMLTPEGSFSVTVPNQTGSSQNWEAWIDSEVCVTGSLAPFFNQRGEITGVQLLVTDLRDLQILRPAPKSTYETRLVPLNRIMPDRTAPYDCHRRQVTGTVTFCLPGEYLYLQSGLQALKVYSDQTKHLQPGDRVNAVGFPLPGPFFYELADAQLRRTGHEPPPKPFVLEEDWTMGIEHKNKEDMDGRLVSMQGKIIQIGEGFNNQRELVFSSAKGNCKATLPIQHPDSRFLSNIPSGQPVELTGIIILTQTPRKGEYRTPFPNSFRLLLRNEDDIRLLPDGPWLTPDRRAGLQSAGVLLILLLAAMMAVMRYRIVRERQRRREANLLQEERKRIAADLHDSLEQDITASDMQMRTAMMAFKVAPEEAADCIRSALQTIAAARCDLRNSLWNLHSNAVVRKSFADAMAEISKRFDRPGKLEIVCALDPAAAYLHEYQSVHLIAIVSEAITNAVKHGNASRITLSATQAGITVTDNGSGFDPQQLATASENGHFGFVNMRERATKINATVHIESALGQGTTVSLRFANG